MSLLFSLLPSDFKSFYDKEGLRIFIGGMSGSGKSYLAKTFVEELAPLFRIIVIDPEGEWKALKVIGETIVVGSSDDVPLSPKLFPMYMETNINLVFNLKEIFHTRQPPMMKKIIEAVFEYDQACILIIEEGQLAAPQQVDTADKRQSLDWVVQIAKRGRKRGMGMIVATQRPADINKSVISQSNKRFFGKVIDKADLDALKPYLQTAGIKHSQISRLSNGDFIFYDGNKARQVRSTGIKMPDLGSARKTSFQPLKTKALSDVIEKITDEYLFADDEENEEDETQKLRFEIQQLKKRSQDVEKELQIFKSQNGEVEALMEDNENMRAKMVEYEAVISERELVIEKQLEMLKKVRTIMQMIE